MIKGILFDFDGTLIDTMIQFKKLAGRLINEYYDITVEEAERMYIETSGLPFEKQIEIIMLNGPHNKAIVERFESEKLEGIMDEEFEEDVIETFDKLKEEGYEIGISSGNFVEVMQKFLEKESVDISYLMGYKPGFEKGKDHFEYFLKQTGLKKDEILFIGDSLKDGERSYYYGVAFIGKVGIFSADRFKEEFGKKQEAIEKISEIWKYIK